MRVSTQETLPLQRVCFTLKLREERLDEYVGRHKHVWPEMQEALRATGWTNYSLFWRRADC